MPNGAHLVQHRLRHMIVENLRRCIAVAVLGTDVRAHHDQDAGTVGVAEVACLFGEFFIFPGSLSTSGGRWRPFSLPLRKSYDVRPTLSVGFFLATARLLAYRTTAMQ